MKTWFQSKTILVNVISAILMLANLALPTIHDPRIIAVVAAVVNLLNVILRLLPKTEIVSEDEFEDFKKRQ